MEPSNAQGSPRVRRRLLIRVLAFFFAAAALVGGLFAFWKFVYLPAEIQTSLRNAKVSGIESGYEEVPKIIRGYFPSARPYLIDALYGENEGTAAVAFVALRYGKRGVETLEKKRFRPDEPGEGTYRAALLIEWENAPGNTAPLGFPPAFRAAFLRWKAVVHPGFFSLSLDQRLSACRELIALEGKDAVPFFVECIRDPVTPPVQKVPMAVLIAGHPEVEGIYPDLLKTRLNPVLFLHALLRRNTPWGANIMEMAFRSGNLQQEDVAITYFLRYPTQRAGDLLRPHLANLKNSVSLRTRIALRFLSLGEKWVDWIWETVSPWPEKDLRHLLYSMPKSFAPIPQPVRRAVITRASADARRGVALDALNAWVVLEGKRAYFPFGHEDLFEGGDPISTLEPPARGLLTRKPEFRSNWAKRAVYSLRTLEAEGRVHVGKKRLNEAVRTAVKYLRKAPPLMETDPPLRVRLIQLAGMLLSRHASILEDGEEVRKALGERVRDREEREESRIEAAFWLAEAGGGEEGIHEILCTGMKGAHPGLRFACAVALARLREAQAVAKPGTPWSWDDPYKVFQEAWEGSNPLHLFLAARETPNLPFALMAGAVGPMLKAYRMPTQETPDLSKAGKEALIFLTCMKDVPKAVKKAEWLRGGIAGGLITLWADRAGIGVDPGKDPAILLRLVSVVEREKEDLGKIRAAVLLLRRWTARRFGFDPLLWNPRHAEEIGGRWRTWLEANRDALSWDTETDRFRIR
ncbi:MAG: hypothetical protein ACYTHM_14400 [Planctomycetota bacterium]